MQQQYVFFYLPDETYINLFYLHIFTHAKRKQRRTGRKNVICCYTKFNQKSDFVLLNCENTAANHLFTGTVSASSSFPCIHIFSITQMLAWYHGNSVSSSSVTVDSWLQPQHQHPSTCTFLRSEQASMLLRTPDLVQLLPPVRLDERNQHRGELEQEPRFGRCYLCSLALLEATFKARIWNIHLCFCVCFSAPEEVWMFASGPFVALRKDHRLEHEQISSFSFCCVFSRSLTSSLKIHLTSSKN